jgi:hypothetical protein
LPAWLLADFDPGVTAIAAQPFLLRAQAGGRLRRHVPDFLLVRADHTVQVVNVKTAARLADPAVAVALAWPGPLFEARGWDHEIWTGAAPVLLTPGLAATLRHAASMHNPEFYERQRMRASTYNIPRFLHCYQETIDGGLILPRGMLDTVTSLAAQAGSRLNITDRRSPGPRRTSPAPRS